MRRIFTPNFIDLEFSFYHNFLDPSIFSARTFQRLQQFLSPQFSTYIFLVWNLFKPNFSFLIKNFWVQYFPSPLFLNCTFFNPKLWHPKFVALETFLLKNIVNQNKCLTKSLWNPNFLPFQVIQPQKMCPLNPYIVQSHISAIAFFV